jgi:hypothetical protein
MKLVAAGAGERGGIRRNGIGLGHAFMPAAWHGAAKASGTLHGFFLAGRGVLKPNAHGLPHTEAVA